MDTYIRFQTQLRCGQTGRPAGIFVSAGRVEDRASTPSITRERIRDILSWFNQNLTVPKLGDNDWRCLFWFRSQSQLVVSRLWELTHLLNDEGIYVNKIRTSQPGEIIYGDTFQIAAVPQRRWRNDSGLAPSQVGPLRGEQQSAK